MVYTKENNCIKIKDKTEFNIAHILECGQIFNYEKTETGYDVFSLNHKASILENEDGYTILTDSPDYFENFFDLKTDYSLIKKALLGKYQFLDEAINFGYGIRILKQDTYEMIISFIISANNNIKRIQKSIKLMCQQFGKKLNGYYAFPTINELSGATVQDLEKLGLGYRAPQMVDALRALKNIDISALKNCTEEDALKSLMSLKGVGPKVADCVALFGLGLKTVFPVDTWIEKVYNEYFAIEPLHDRKVIRKNLVQIFGENSGYAQQYLFYFQRSNVGGKR